MAILLLASLPISAVGQDESARAAWEMLPYRIHLLTAVEADASLPSRLEQELSADLASRVSAAVGGAWRLEVSRAPAELRHRILHSLADVTSEILPAAAKKGDKVMLLGIASSENGYVVRARELDLATGLWNTTATHSVRQAAGVKQETLRCLLWAFAPQARIEKVDDKIVTLKLRAAALARPDANQPLLISGTVFRPVLLKCDARGAIVAAPPEPIGWTFLIPTESKTASSPFTARIETGLSGAVIPEYHPTRLRLALGVSPSQDSTKVKLAAEGDAAPLEGYEVAVQEPEAAGKPGAVLSLGRSGPAGIVVVPPSPSAVRILLVRHGEEVLARLPLVPGLAEEITISLADDRPRLAVESALGRIQDDLVDLVARREVLVSRIKAASTASNTAAADKLKDQLQKLPSVDPLLAELAKQQQAADALEGPARQKMQAKLAEIRKLAERLKSENPASKL
ncbi:MAG: hypothetical protein ACR2FY_02250 [Pirellulaceae bacterium]